MGRRIAVAVLALMAVGGTGAAPEPGDLNRIQGRWEAAVGKRKDFAVVLEVKGSEVSATITPRVGPKLKASGEVQIDEAASPRSIDWVKFSTPEGIEVPTLHGIYRIEGDRLIVRSGGFNDARPEKFEKGGEGCWSDVLVFVRPDAAPKSSDVSANR